MRLIDADALKKTFHTSFGGVSHAVIAGQLIDEAPTVDLVKHGRWIYRGGTGACSLCGFVRSLADLAWSYCPNCGAKMDL